MVKWPWSRTIGKPLPKRAFVGETLKAKPQKQYIYHIADRIYSWPFKCVEYDKYYNNHPEVKSQVLSIAGQATAKGIFLEPRTEFERGKEAADECNRLNEEVGMDKLLYETIIPLAKYGTVLWEKTQDPEYSMQIIPVVGDYKPVDYENFNVSKWEILERGIQRSPPLILGVNNFAEFSWNITSDSWPFGTSLLAGLGQTLEITEQLIDDLEEYLHKAAFPGGLFQVGDNEGRPDTDELNSINSKIRNWAPGENYTTSWNIDYKVVGPAQAETRNLDAILNYLKDRLIDGLMVAPVSKQYQRTLASAETMVDQTQLSLIIPIQRLLKRTLERQIYRPFLEFRGYSVKNVPTVSFSPPDENRDEQADYYIKLVRSGIVTREAAARELGVKPEDVPKEEEHSSEERGEGEEDKLKRMLSKVAGLEEKKE